jgi:hypothetical protein
LGRLAEDYLLDSDASVKVVGLYIEHGKKGSREATLSVWRIRVFHTENGDQLGVIQEVENEVCISGLRPMFSHYGVLRFLTRHFATMTETLRLTQAYDFNCPTLLVKS